MRVPIPLSKYWMALKEAAEDAGERTDKQELVLAILATTPIDGVALAERLRSYRLLRNADLPGLFATDENVIHLPGPTLGRKGAGSAY
ncbi:MAG TPA: hypothetical protein VN193_04240 [Candidatus Angelobacter sp.]|jgi:hypothetical protein|nr:hypothetical protein [Candidatus Angelobacter sp.]